LNVGDQHESRKPSRIFGFTKKNEAKDKKHIAPEKVSRWGILESRFCVERRHGGDSYSKKANGQRREKAERN
jgi:hypothetical protein